uniref:Uncharacterized protein n=1 Tax=Leersia perrieri TaxID=77586 RepID=A0A0D9VBY2_9ORYZ
MAPPRRRPCVAVVSALRVAFLVFVLLLMMLCVSCDGAGAGDLHRRTFDSFLPPSGPSERHNARLDSDDVERGQISSPSPASP